VVIYPNLTNYQPGEPDILPDDLHPVVIYVYMSFVPIYANFIFFCGNLSKPDKLPHIKNRTTHTTFVDAYPQFSSHQRKIF
jgi:hypothetical protein